MNSDKSESTTPHSKLRRLLTVLGILVFGGILWFLHYELRNYRYQELIQAVRATPLARLLPAILLTVLNYLFFPLYDYAALKSIKCSLKPRKIAFASIVSNAFSNLVGHPALTGGSLRFRLYSAWGLSSVEITSVIGFTLFASSIGLVTAAGILFCFFPQAIPLSIRWEIFATTRPVGILFLLLVATYFCFVLSPKKSLRWKGWSFEIPGFRVSAVQVLMGVFDWLLAAAIFYVLVPQTSPIGYVEVLAVFLFAQIAGIVSHIPGGLGVFEVVVLAFLTPKVAAADLVPAMVVYRGVYYLLPLLVSSLMLAVYEFRQKSSQFAEWARAAGNLSPRITPNLLAVSTFVAGVILIFSGATPAVLSRVHVLRDLLPLPVMEVSHFLGSLAGVALLFLAIGLQRRINAAYHLTLFLLSAGIAVSLLKGFDYEEAIILSIMLTAFIPSKRHFYRKSSLLNEPFTPGWILAISVVLLVSTWLGFFVYKHINYSHELWWRFGFDADAPRFMRAFVGTAVFALLFSISHLLRTAKIKSVPQNVDWQKVYGIVLKAKNIEGNLALLGDKSFLFNDAQTAFIMYGVKGKSFVALGDPVGPEEDWPDLIWKFRATADRHEGWTVFSEVGHEHLYLYLEVGLSMMKMGEEARVGLEDFSLEGHASKELRQMLRKGEREGLSFRFIPRGEVPERLAEFKAISDVWLEAKNTREKGFSLGFFDENYLKYFPSAAVVYQDKIIAFANIWESSVREEFSIDLMRYLPNEALHSVIDFLFVQLMLWGKAQGYRWFNLGMAPLAGLENRSFAPLWNRLGGMIFRHGENFYNFQGLRNYKNKFNPVWKPKYLASPGGLALPRILADVSALGSRGYKGIFLK